MSLFLGNLSSHTHRDELERVFRRFGRCDVQLKDGYGFAIYEVPENAERALRSLRGKQICGENIALDWSKKQPRPFQRFSGGRRFYEPYGRNFRDEGNGERSKDPRHHRNFAMGRGRRPTFSHRGHRFDEMDYTHEDVGNLREEKGPTLKERTFNEGDAVEPSPVGNDRWGEPVNDSSEGNGAEDEAEFERYEPSRGLDRRDDNEHHRIPGSDGSPVQVSSPEKGRRDHSSDAARKQFDNMKLQLTCFICGQVGHKMRNCPRGDRSRQDKLDRFERRDNEVNFKARSESGLKRKRPTSWGWPNTGRDPLLSRHYAGDGKGSQSQKPRKLDRRDSSQDSMENHHRRVRRESRGRNRVRHESGTHKKVRRKRSTKRSHSSSLHSDSVASSSRSKSRSSRSVSGISSRSRSRSVSSRSHSESSSSRSVSSYSKSRSSRSRSMTRSRTRSLSVSLDQNLPSSAKDAAAVIDASAKGEMVHVSSPESKGPLAAHSNSNSKLKGVFEDENAFTSSKVDVDTYEELNAVVGCEDGNFSDSNIGHKEKDSCMDLLDKVSYSSDKSSENLEEESNLGEAQSERLSHQILVGCQDSKSTKMSLQEMCVALKHYGLAAPEESEPGLSVGTYFGAARLWPWEMIYYRRLKKGPITTENYASRIAQNKEFGIVDKYIRSSSGWGESEPNDT